MVRRGGWNNCLCWHLTLYVQIIAILDIWKTTRVSVLSYISLPVHILYDNQNIFLKLIKFVSFWHQDHENSKGNVDQTVTLPVVIAGVIQIVTQGVTACGAFLLIVKIETVSSLSPSSSAELLLESYRSVLSALMSEESPDKLERSLSLSAKTAASAWSASMTKHNYDRCLRRDDVSVLADYPTYVRKLREKSNATSHFLCCHGN